MSVPFDGTLKEGHACLRSVSFAEHAVFMYILFACCLVPASRTTVCEIVKAILLRATLVALRSCESTCGTWVYSPGSKTQATGVHVGVGGTGRGVVVNIEGR